MYRLFKSTLLKLLKAPAEPPEPPQGSPESVVVFRASEKFLTLKLIGLAIGFLPICGVLGFLTVLSGIESQSSIGYALMFLFFSAIAALRYFAIRIDYDMRYYIITDRSLRVRRGAMMILESTYTYANVQNVTIQQGPLERLLGISNLQIRTAGGGGPPAQQSPGMTFHAGALAGIDNAEEVRDQVLALLKAYRDAGLGDHGDAAPTPTKAAIDAGSTQRLAEILAEIRALRGKLRPG